MFKGRISESRDRETAIERCDVELHDGADKLECRLIIKMICGQGNIMATETLTKLEEYRVAC